jgi:serine O-acetyltransferase
MDQATLDAVRGIPEVVEDLCTADHGIDLLSEITKARRQLPSQRVVVAAFEAVRSALFPGYFEATEVTPENLKYHVGASLDAGFRQLKEQIRRGLCFNCPKPSSECVECPDKAERVARRFLETLPAIRHLLALDVLAAYEGDPAATSADEAVFCYPGIYAITSHRIAHELHRLGVPLIPRIISEHAHSVTGIDIHPGAQIGERFFIDHGTGVVIGETCVIGDNVRIYQGVTLGAKKFELDENGNPIKGVPRHPVVEDNVVIYSGATILGRVRVGRDSVVGGNVWVVRDVEPGSKVTTRPAKLERYSEGSGI